MYRYFNPNPVRTGIGDCVIRAICKIFNMSWLDAYDAVVDVGRELYNLPNGNDVWGMFLIRNGFHREAVADKCPMCYTVKEFCRDNPYGEYILHCGQHVIPVINGDWYDTSDTGDEVPQYYYWR